MKTEKILLLLIFLFSLGACQHDSKDVFLDNATPVSIGAVYISCDAPPWIFNMDGLLSCQQSMPATLGLNPENSCPFETIADDNGAVSITFSDNLQLGRMHVVKLKDDIVLRNQQNDSVEELFVNEADHFFLEQNDVRLKTTIKNAYVGGCYHEMIQWERVF